MVDLACERPVEVEPRRRYLKVVPHVQQSAHVSDLLRGAGQLHGPVVPRELGGWFAFLCDVTRKQVRAAVFDLTAAACSFMRKP